MMASSSNASEPAVSMTKRHIQEVTRSVEDCQKIVNRRTTSNSLVLVTNEKEMMYSRKYVEGLRSITEEEENVVAEGSDRAVQAIYFYSLSWWQYGPRGWQYVLVQITT